MVPFAQQAREMDDEDLQRAYQQLVAPVLLHRAYSDEYTADMKRHGLDPSKNPYHDWVPRIVRFLELISALERRGFAFTLRWGGKPVSAQVAARVTLQDLERQGVSFTPDPVQLSYYMGVLKDRGGALPSNIAHLARDILEHRPTLPEGYSMNEVKSALAWALKRGSYPLRICSVNGDAPALAQAELIQRSKFHKRLKSPFGTFDSFREACRTEGEDTIMHALQDKDYYLLVLGRIPPQDLWIR